MISSFLEFIKLYTDETQYFQGIVISFILLYVNAGLYLVDLYHLVKRKSKAETISVMMIPGVFVFLSQAMAACFIHVPNPLQEASPDGFLHMTEMALLPQTNLALLLIALFYLVLWGIGLLRQKRGERGSRSRWLLSCIPDYIVWLLLVCGACYHLLCGEDILYQIIRHTDAGNYHLLTSYGIWLHIWMYAFYLLLCKEAVLLVGFLSEMLLLRIPLCYRSGQNASSFVAFYFLFCQNAVLRGAFLAEAILVFPICALAVRDLPSAGKNAFMMVYITLFLLVGMTFVVLCVIRPIMRTLAYFDAWGERRQIRELFCTEYFLLQPVSKNKSFTVTYHFIIDEKDAAGVYYLPLLTKISGWTYLKNRKDKVKFLIFADGRSLELTEQEIEPAREMISYAANRLSARETNGMSETLYHNSNAPGTEENWNPFQNKAATPYQKALKFFMIVLILLFFMCYTVFGQ